MSKYLALMLMLFPFASLADSVATIEELLNNGKSALLDKDYERAFQNCKKGLVELGDTYFMDDTLDDTGQTLVLAEVSAMKGNYETASPIACNALSTRIFLFKRKFGLIKSEEP